MKYKAVLKNLTLFMLIACTVFVSVFCANAVDDLTDIDSQVETQEEIGEETTPQLETEYVPEETDDHIEEQTEAPTEEPEQNQPETDYIEELTEEQQTEVEETQEQNQENQQGNAQSETIQTKTLPTIAPTTEKRVVNKDDLTYGYVSWSCVAAGVLVLIIVFISIKSAGIKQSRRKRR
ncbi:MAG: hypothetical protein J1E56_03140 [Ruminococcus sp.]|nr:hypothetical protein [Ruminococcus sp.]